MLSALGSVPAPRQTDPSGPDPMPDLESHSGQRLDCQNLFIDVDAPLVDDIVSLIKNTPGVDAKDASFA